MGDEEWDLPYDPDSVLELTVYFDSRAHAEQSTRDLPAAEHRKVHAIREVDGEWLVDVTIRGPASVQDGEEQIAPYFPHHGLIGVEHS